MFNEILKSALGTAIALVTGYATIKGIGYAEKKLAERKLRKSEEEEAAPSAEKPQTARQRAAAKAAEANA